MINKSLQNKLLDQILQSKEFSTSKIYQSYLTYLVNAADEEKSLKEITIAIDVFGKDADFNPAEDTIVRSHTYTLRKKLESYYFQEGKDDPYQLKIPKGHYEVKFVHVDKDLIKNKSGLYKAAIYIPWILVIVLLAITGYVWEEKSAIESEFGDNHPLKSDDPIWKEYLNSELPIMIVPGDHFFFLDTIEKYGKEVTIRDVTINSMEDLDKYRLQYPNYRLLQAAPEPYFPYHSLWCLPPVLKMLYAANQDPILRRSSTISPQILDEYNFIFVGSIKTLYIFQHTLSTSHFKFEIAPHKVIYTPPDSGQVQEFTTNLHSTGPNEDLVLALKLPGPTNNTIFIIASYHSLGAPEVANLLIERSRRKEIASVFEEKYGRIPSHFEILFRVTGIDKTAYQTEVLVCNEIVKN